MLASSSRFPCGGRHAIHSAPRAFAPAPGACLIIAPALPNVAHAPHHAGIVTGAGVVRAAGGAPNVVDVNPVGLTALQLATDANDRPLVGTTEGGMGTSVAGLTMWPTPATPARTAVVAEASQIIVAVRGVASVAVSDQFAFNADGRVVRVIGSIPSDRH